METKQAKDFLVQQAAEQAARENLPFSDIEKNMMYFTENDPDSCENPVETNDAFEAQYDTAEYEAKISRLLHHAYDRLKAENPEGKRHWDHAIRALRKGDHYILVLWDIQPRPKGDFLRLFGTALLIATGVIAAIVLAVKYDIDSDRFVAYLTAAVVAALFLTSGTVRVLYRAAVAWFQRQKNEDTELP